MLSAYPACFFHEENGFSVIFPDLNYLSTCGDSLNEALEMSIDCLAGYLFWQEKDHEDIPKPSSISSIDPREIMNELEIDDCTEYFVNIVTVDVQEYAKLHFEKSVKKTLTIPSWMNDQAISLGINFSQLLQEALLKNFKNYN